MIISLQKYKHVLPVGFTKMLRENYNLEISRQLLET